MLLDIDFYEGVLALQIPEVYSGEYALDAAGFLDGNKMLSFQQSGREYMVLRDFALHCIAIGHLAESGDSYEYETVFRLLESGGASCLLRVVMSTYKGGPIRFNVVMKKKDYDWGKEHEFFMTADRCLFIGRSIVQALNMMRGVPVQPMAEYPPFIETGLQWVDAIKVVLSGCFGAGLGQVEEYAHHLVMHLTAEWPQTMVFTKVDEVFRFLFLIGIVKNKTIPVETILSPRRAWRMKRVNSGSVDFDTKIAVAWCCRRIPFVDFAVARVSVLTPTGVAVAFYVAQEVLDLMALQDFDLFEVSGKVRGVFL